MLTLLDAEGEYPGGVAPAWAKDAEGQDVPIRYEIDGTTVTQVIEHTGDEVVHPVTADPWLGIDLFSETSVDDYEGDIRVNAQKSVWGQVNPTPTPGGWGIFFGPGWNELVDKQPDLAGPVVGVAGRRDPAARRGAR